MDKQLIANDLLPIYQTTDTGERVVDGRELHGFLNVGRDFSTWLRDRIGKFGFVEGEDFSPVPGKTSDTGGRPTTDYILKLDMAKELAMVENNEQGRKARKYFIEVEKRYRSGQVPTAAVREQPPFPEFDQITKLLQMIRMGEREGLFNGATNQALRRQVAELVLGEPQGVIVAPVSPAQPQLLDYSGRWYTSKEIAALAKVTVHLISNLASTHGLRTDAHCRLQSNRPGERSTGLTWVEYNEAGKNMLLKYAAERIANGYTPRLGQKWSKQRDRRRK